MSAAKECVYFQAQKQPKAILIQKNLLLSQFHQLCIFNFPCEKFFGLYFCIYPDRNRLIFITCKKDNALAVFLNDKPKKYKYKL
jgi:hypothetical protein